jgi:hypothetical protein
MPDLGKRSGNKLLRGTSRERVNRCKGTPPGRASPFSHNPSKSRFDVGSGNRCPFKLKQVSPTPTSLICVLSALIRGLFCFSSCSNLTYLRNRFTHIRNPQLPIGYLCPLNVQPRNIEVEILRCLSLRSIEPLLQIVWRYRLVIESGFDG